MKVNCTRIPHRRATCHLTDLAAVIRTFEEQARPFLLSSNCFRSHCHSTLPLITTIVRPNFVSPCPACILMRRVFFALPLSPATSSDARTFGKSVFHIIMSSNVLRMLASLPESLEPFQKPAQCSLECPNLRDMRPLGSTFCGCVC